MKPVKATLIISCVLLASLITACIFASIMQTGYCLDQPTHILEIEDFKCLEKSEAIEKYYENQGMNVILIVGEHNTTGELHMYYAIEFDSNTLEPMEDKYIKKRYYDSFEDWRNDDRIGRWK